MTFTCLIWVILSILILQLSIHNLNTLTRSDYRLSSADTVCSVVFECCHARMWETWLMQLQAARRCFLMWKSPDTAEKINPRNIRLTDHCQKNLSAVSPLFNDCVAVAAKITLLSCLSLPCLFASSLEWHSSASGCGHGAKRWFHCVSLCVTISSLNVLCECFHLWMNTCK